MAKSVFRVMTAVSLIAGGLIAGQVVLPASATHQPANKVAVSGSAFEILTDNLTAEGSASTTATILTASMKASAPTDLIFKLTAECALWTNVQVTGNGASEAFAQVVMWIEVDGQPVKVSPDDVDNPQTPGDETGRVVFCNRAFRNEVQDLNDEDAVFRQFLRTRTANAFNWLKLNVGSGLHTIEVKARLDQAVTGTGLAAAGVGKRTLVVFPEKLASHAEF